ncbi:MAG: hypothetical protein L3J98_03255 [Gammaproteobacteria bacterium]|nr:hypothetical protein [Gammaproteobacteria bacterium]MCF6259167.1 hypothetical protein [Gammaproteobacteria bacterium]
MKKKILFTPKGFFITFIFLFFSSQSSADIRSLQQLEAAEDIEIASQQVAKAYFYLHQEIRVEQSERDLKNGLDSIEKNINILTNTKDKKQQRMVKFMSFTLDEIKETTAQPYTNERGALMLDYSETLLEGAESLAKKYTHTKDKKEKMLIVTKKMTFLLERATKYYIAFRDGFADHNNVKQLEKSIKDFEVHLKTIRAYKYPAEPQRAVSKIIEYWPIAKEFYLGVEKNDLPLIVSVTTNHLEKSLAILENYHHNLAEGK